jgi:hypothetical protein
MKRSILFLTVFLICAAISAQVAVTTMKVSATDHDFGKFREEAGRQTFDFIVTNTGSQPLVIQNVVASCGCTTPDWTRQPIASGGTGKVTAIYDPKDRPGAFNKTLTVYSNTNDQVVLTIKGEVIPHEKTIEELYTFAVKGIRFETNHLAFTNVKKNEKKMRVMQLINNSNRPIKVQFADLPAHLALRSNPETLKPGQKGLVEGTYDGTKNPQWGSVSDLIKMKLNDTIVETVYYYVSANLVEDFSALSKEDFDKAPVLKFETTTVDLGKVKGGTQNDVEFRFTNAGKNDLIIRNVKSTCGCTAVQQGNQGVGIKAGQSSSIKATFNAGGYNGPVTKAIYVYSNDPKLSEIVLMLNANVEPVAPAAPTTVDPAGKK